LKTKFQTADKPVGERKFNGERSWCYSTGPAGMWAGRECGTRVRCARTSSRDEHRDDRRFQSIALTPAGRRLIPELAALADQNDEEFFRPLSTGERAALIAMMKKLVQAHRLQTLPTE